ncbi:type II toxin-antitoxin system VapC family toxin [Candidatus Woesearchaeota archaeon]|nr:type II toxin-antitoxin system VapC family toxin [Candidatus Woesearchaeota archaeon]
MERHKVREIVIDASVLVKWFAEEPDSAAARTLRDLIVRGELDAAAPDVAIFEVANALHFTHKLSPQGIQEAARALMDAGIVFRAPDDGMMGHAAELARTHRLSIYDAAYAAIARDRGAALVTADRLLSQVRGAVRLDAFARTL